MRKHILERQRFHGLVGAQYVAEKARCAKARGSTLDVGHEQRAKANRAATRCAASQIYERELLPNTKCQGWSGTVAARCRFVSF
jgi:hypothetical protein